MMSTTIKLTDIKDEVYVDVMTLIETELFNRKRAGDLEFSVTLGNVLNPIFIGTSGVCTRPGVSDDCQYGDARLVSFHRYRRVVVVHFKAKKRNGRYRPACIKVFNFKRLDVQNGGVMVTGVRNVTSFAAVRKTARNDACSLIYDIVNEK